MPRTGLSEEGTQTDMDLRQEDTPSVQQIQRDLDDLKESVEYAHQNNIRAQTQVGNAFSQSQLANERLDKLEREVSSLKSYTTELEDYCISLDSILRKHHLLLNGIPETPNESVGLAAFRVLQVCFQEINVSDIDYCYRVGTPPPTWWGGRYPKA